MKVGLISDIHGNLAALETVLASLEAERPDRVVCLGDVAATGPQPRETLRRLRASGCPVVMGNADAFLLAPRMATDAGEDERRVAEIDRWCAEQLEPSDLDWVRTFQPTVELGLGGGRRLLCFHGSPRGYDEIISAATPEEALDGMLAGHDAPWMAGGHWHFQMLRKHRGTTLVNPGSVG